VSQNHRSSGPIVCRGVRGATTADTDTRKAILDATRDLLRQIVDANGIDLADVASAIFTASPDLSAAHPATAARELGWADVPLLSAQEIDVPDGLARAIRVLIHWNTTASQTDIHHIYTKGAEVLRPDLTTRFSSQEADVR
jgi:chorismate mutase